MKAYLLILLLVPLAYSQATEGGNISSVNATLEQESAWHGVCGQVSPSAASPVSFSAVAGNITCLNISTGSASCASGVQTLNLLFSNSSAAIASLAPGNLSALDSFIGRPNENGTVTLTLSSSFATAGFGNISAVPSVYTNSAPPNAFLMGYLQDQGGNLVFITPVVSDQPGFNGTPFDFQLMVPTGNGTAITYYVSVDLACAPVAPGGDDDEEDKDPLSVRFVSSCEGNLINVTSRGDPVSGARVFAGASFIGETNGSGQLEYPACGDEIEIRATKSGYSSAAGTFSLVGCDECAVPPQPPANETPLIPPPPVQTGCDSDSDCLDAEYCSIPAGHSSGSCFPVAGCGVPRNHTLVPYQCGQAPGCPSCPANLSCVDNICVLFELIGPERGFIGDEINISARENGAPCAFCDLEITYPSGKKLAGKTDASGNLTIPLEFRGLYTISLIKKGLIVKSLNIASLLKPEEEEGKPTVRDEFPCLPLLLLILLIILAAYLLSRRRRKGGRK